MRKRSTAKLFRNSDLYLSRIKLGEEEARVTPLPNVRERALRAASVWQEMYDRAQQAEQRPGR